MIPLGSTPYQDFPSLVGRVVWSKNTGNWGLITAVTDDRDGWWVQTTFSTPKGLSIGGYWAISFMSRYEKQPEKVVVFLLGEDRFVVEEPNKPELQLSMPL